MTILADTPCLANEPKKLNTSTVKQLDLNALWVNGTK